MQHGKCGKTLVLASLFVSSVLSVAAMAKPAHAVNLLSGFGGQRGYGTEGLGRNDDSSTGALPLPFAVNFFGNTYSNFYANNNGNITFNGPVSGYTPTPFPISNRPMIAPFWGDVDTSANPGDNSNLLWLHAPNPTTLVATWDQVGYYSSHNDLRNDFQLVLRGRADTGAGNFDIDFRYHQLQWTTGDASGGSGGFGGTPAQAGFDAGNGVNFLTLPGSRTASVLDLQNTSNVSSSTPGLWTFAVRNGGLPGSSPSNPLLPVTTANGFNFQFGVGDPTQRVFIDPHLAIGYDYIVNSGPLVASVLLPTGIGDNLFDLSLWNGSNFVFDSLLTGGVVHNFSLGGVDRFRISGIEVSAGLSSSDPLAFVTGLTFTQSGVVDMSQIPLGNAHSTSPVPEPATVVLVASGLAGLAVWKRRKQE